MPAKKTVTNKESKEKLVKKPIKKKPAKVEVIPVAPESKTSSNSVNWNFIIAGLYTLLAVYNLSKGNSSMFAVWIGLAIVFYILGKK